VFRFRNSWAIFGLELDTIEPGLLSRVAGATAALAALDARQRPEEPA
jgi:hypothetical protein